jgi:[NiFe] hydrogenase diaphorase moiety large subunit
MGMTVRVALQVIGAEDAVAVQVGGPSGTFIGEEDFDRKICYDDLGTGGAMMVFGPERDILETVLNFARFFEEESCGWCVPCRVGTRLMRAKLEKILGGNGTRKDLEELKNWGQSVRLSSRCGLGQTAANPELTTLANFRRIYEERIKEDEYLTGFNLESAVEDAFEATGRTAIHE